MSKFFYKYKYLILIVTFLSLYAFITYYVLGIADFRVGKTVLLLPVGLVFLVVMYVLDRENKRKKK